MDLHSPQIQGFFSVPVDNLTGVPVLVKYIQGLGLENLTVVSPDAGGVGRAKYFAQRLDAKLAIIDKRRPAPNVAQVFNVIGDVAGQNCVLFDDMVDTAGTLFLSAEALMKPGPAGSWPPAPTPSFRARPWRRSTPRPWKHCSSPIPSPSRKKPRPARKIARPVRGRAVRRSHPPDQRRQLRELAVRLRRKTA